MGWFNKTPPEMLYVCAEVKRLFGVMPNAIRVRFDEKSGKIVKEAEHYNETLILFYQLERHSHHSLQNSFAIHCNSIMKELASEFFGNCQIDVNPSDFDSFMRWHECIKDLECMEARFR